VPEYGVQKFLYGIGAFVALLVIIGLALPRHARVEVSTTIDARPATVFALVNDFRRAQLWSPRSHRRQWHSDDYREPTLGARRDHDEPG
jgi:hypothetical protein